MSEVIRLQLTPAQAELLSPLVLGAARRHENVIFIAVTAPLRSQEELTWHFQVITAPAQLGQKIKKLILTGGKK
jgi:hypothetical protein